MTSSVPSGLHSHHPPARKGSTVTDSNGTTTRTLLERHIPSTRFSERHSRWIDASPDAVWAALSRLTFGDLTLTRPLIALRHPGADRSRLQTPMMDSGPVTMLYLNPPHYAVGGAVAKPWLPKSARVPVTTLAEFDAFDEPGWAKYLTDFSVTNRDGGRLGDDSQRHAPGGGPPGHGSGARPRAVQRRGVGDVR